MVILPTVFCLKKHVQILKQNPYLSDTLGAEINHITISTQEQYGRLHWKQCSLAMYRDYSAVYFFGLLLGIGRVAGSVTTIVFRGDILGDTYYYNR